MDFLHVFLKVFNLHLSLTFWRVTADDPVITYRHFKQLPTTGSWSRGRQRLTNRIWSRTEVVGGSSWRFWDR